VPERGPDATVGASRLSTIGATGYEAPVKAILGIVVLGIIAAVAVTYLVVRLLTM
jgi:hypothetical protein